MMRDDTSLHQVLQNNIDCMLETNPGVVLKKWADEGWQQDEGVDVDETCLKYLALVLLDALSNKAQKIVLEMGCPALVASEGVQHMLPAAPESILARGLEIVREICGMEGAAAEGRLALGIRNNSIELRIEKSEALHIIHLPRF
ncbi:hypothetical protein ACFL43_04910 [Thermodesulfobacteriota bacterium]